MIHEAFFERDNLKNFEKNFNIQPFILSISNHLSYQFLRKIIINKFLDDVIEYEDKLYEEISNVVENVLGDNVSEKQKLQLFNYLLCRAQEESELYNNYFNEECYNDTYPIFNQQSCFNIYIPLSQPPFQYYFQPQQQQPIYPTINKSECQSKSISVSIFAIELLSTSIDICFKTRER